MSHDNSSKSTPEQDHPAHVATYASGSIFGHLSNLAITSAVGMFAIMIVDLVDMYFISILGKPALAAAVGFAGLGLFLGASVCIGISVAVSTLVAQSLGEEDEEAARRLTVHGLIYSLLWTIPITILTMIYARELMSLIGATGESLELAVLYFRIVGVSLPVLGITFCAIALLRAVSDPKMSMWATIIGGLVNAVMDPLLIFGMGLGLNGAAIASVISRFSVFGIGIYGLFHKHELIAKPDWRLFFQDIRAVNSLAVPSILTNLSAPVSSAFATAQMAKFGTDAVAAAAVIGRLTPVAFCGLYGLSGAVGPVASQNVGAHQYNRVRETLLAGAKFVVIYVLPVTLLMSFLTDWLVSVFDLTGEAADLLGFYTTFIVISYLLFGLQLSTNPLFTALHHPGFATASNLGRDLLLAIPFIYLFSSWFGPQGVLAGQALANALAGLLAFATGMWMTRQVIEQDELAFSWHLPCPRSWMKPQLHHHRHVIPGVQHRGY